MVTDEELAGQVRQALLADDRLSVQSIAVAARDGVVTLTGVVPSHRWKLAAYEVAASIEGCEGVVNNLSVEPPGDVSDQQLAHDVRAALDSNDDVPKETVAVSVSQGTVTLTGSVGSVWERDLAEDVARGTAGVRKVITLLAVSTPTQVEDSTLSHDIEAALRQTPGLEDKQLRAAVSAESVVLSGEVDEPWQKDKAESVTRGFQVMNVRNDIVVSGSGLTGGIRSAGPAPYS